MAIKDSEKVQEFSSPVSIIINQIIGYEDTIENKKIVQKILRCMPAKYEQVVAAIEESKDLLELSLDELMGSLEAHEEKMSRFIEQDLEQAFQSKVGLHQEKYTDQEQQQQHVANITRYSS